MSTVFTEWVESLAAGSLSPHAFLGKVRQAVVDHTIDHAALLAGIEDAQRAGSVSAELAAELRSVAATAVEQPVVAEPSKRSEPLGSIGGVAGKTEFRREDTIDAPTPPSIQATLAVGSIVDRRYELVARLGGGGMGVVFKALDQLARNNQDPDPYVALKVLSESLRADSNAVMALQREAKRTQKLTHPSIVRVYEFGCDRDTQTYFITMELLEGSSLDTVLAEFPEGQSWEQIAPLVHQAGEALELAHAEGLVHSDLKPSNLFKTSSGTLKILDFGIAAPVIAETADARETRFNPRQFGALSPAYASLEMFLGFQADPRDDVYSFACVVYEWLSGRPPYTSPDAPRTALEAPKALDRGLKPSRIPKLTKSQNRALMNSLALRRAERTATVREFVAGLSTIDHPRWPLYIGAVLLTFAVIAGAGWWLHSPLKPPQIVDHPPPPIPPVTPLPTPPKPPLPMEVCQTPLNQAALDAELNAGFDAQAALALYPTGTPKHTAARENLKRALHCLENLERGGLKSKDSVIFQRDASLTLQHDGSD